MSFDQLLFQFRKIPSHNKNPNKFEIFKNDISLLYSFIIILHEHMFALYSPEYLLRKKIFPFFLFFFFVCASRTIQCNNDFFFQLNHKRLIEMTLCVSVFECVENIRKLLLCMLMETKIGKSSVHFRSFNHSL